MVDYRHAVGTDLNDIADLSKCDLVGGDAVLQRQVGIKRHMPMLSVEWQNVFWLEGREDLDQFVSAGMSGNMHHRAGRIDDIGPGPKEFVDDAEDRRFVAR